MKTHNISGKLLRSFKHLPLIAYIRGTGCGELFRVLGAYIICIHQNKTGLLPGITDSFTELYFSSRNRVSLSWNEIQFDCFRFFVCFELERVEPIQPVCTILHQGTTAVILSLGINLTLCMCAHQSVCVCVLVSVHVHVRNCNRLNIEKTKKNVSKFLWKCTNCTTLINQKYLNICSISMPDDIHTAIYNTICHDNILVYYKFDFYLYICFQQ